MIHTIARFAGLPLAVAAAAITISAASASAQVAVDVAAFAQVGGSVEMAARE
jgi:hypothetical protein